MCFTYKSYKKQKKNFDGIVTITTARKNPYFHFQNCKIFKNLKIFKILDFRYSRDIGDAIHANRSICRPIIPILAQKTKKVPVGTFRYTQTVVSAVQRYQKTCLWSLWNIVSHGLFVHKNDLEIWKSSKSWSFKFIYRYLGNLENPGFWGFSDFLNQGGSKRTVPGSVTGSLLSRMNLINIIFMKNKNVVNDRFPAQEWL